jgi:hypothetical protein
LTRPFGQGLGLREHAVCLARVCHWSSADSLVGAVISIPGPVFVVPVTDVGSEHGAACVGHRSGPSWMALLGESDDLAVCGWVGPISCGSSAGLATLGPGGRDGERKH